MQESSDKERTAKASARAEMVSRNIHIKKGRADLVPVALEFAKAMYIGPIGAGTTLSGQCNSDRSDGVVSLIELEDGSSQKSATGETSKSGCMAHQQTGLNVVFDTGSTNIWIASDLCKSGGCTLPGRARFNHSTSATFVPTEDRYLNVQF